MVGLYWAVMLPSFFESVLELVTRTSTDLPPDVRAAMSDALTAEPSGTRAKQALTIIAQNIDLAVDTEGAICQDTGMPTFEIRVPVGANQNLDGAADPRRRGRGHAPRQAAAQLGRLDHRPELRRQPGAGHADPALRTVGARRHRDPADPEGRRLREHQRAVRAAGGAAAPRPRRPEPRGRAQVHPPRRVAGAGEGLQSRSGRRRRRRRPHVGIHAREGAALPHAGRREPRPAARRARGVRDGRRQRSRDRTDGLRRQGHAHRLQEWAR